MITGISIPGKCRDEVHRKIQRKNSLRNLGLVAQEVKARPGHVEDGAKWPLPLVAAISRRRPSLQRRQFFLSRTVGSHPRKDMRYLIFTFLFEGGKKYFVTNSVFVWMKEWIASVKLLDQDSKAGIQMAFVSLGQRTATLYRAPCFQSPAAHALLWAGPCWY